MKNIYKTNIYFPRNSFFIGFGSVLNLFGRYYLNNYSFTPNETDINAIANDWFMIGQDISNAIDNSEHIYNTQSIHE